MNNIRQKVVGTGLCRPDGAWPLAGARATKMPLLTELGDGVNGICFLHENRHAVFESVCQYHLAAWMHNKCP